MKKQNSLPVIFLLLLLTFTACEFSPKQKSREEKPTEEMLGKPTQLGKKEKNPYSLKYMEKAMKSFGFLSGSDTLIPNRIYVKLMPKSVDEVNQIFDRSGDYLCISEYPMENEIVTNGDYYLEKDNKDVLVKTYYAIAYTLKDLPKVNYSILDYAYVPSPEEWRAEAAAFESAGYSVRSLTPYIPKGKLTIQKLPRSSIYKEPCKLKKIKIRRFSKWCDVVTDTLGNFTSTLSFVHGVDVFILNENIDYRILGNTVEDKVGEINKSVNNKEFLLDDAATFSAWIKGVINNTVYDYNRFIGIDSLKIYNAKLWVPVFSGPTGSTIMMNRFSFSPHEISPADLSAPFNDFGFYVWNKKDYSYLQKLFFHEYSHWSHAIIGGRDFWKNVCKSEATNINNTLTPVSRADYKDPYRNGLEPDAAKAQMLGFAEAWAEFASLVITDKYGIEVLEYPTSIPEKANPKRIPHASHSASNRFVNSWIVAGLFWDLKDRNNERDQKNIDGVAGTADNFTYTMPFLISQLSGAKNVSDYRNNLLGHCPPRDVSALRDLFSAYGY